MRQCKIIYSIYVLFHHNSYIIYRYACGVDFGDKYIVTGGMNASKFNTQLNTVAEYSVLGFVRYLTPMNKARRSHACSKFVTDSGDTVSCFLVSKTIIGHIHILLYRL